MLDALSAATRRWWTKTTEDQLLLEAEAFVVWQNRQAGNLVTIDVHGRPLDDERRARYPNVDSREHDDRLEAYQRAVNLLSPSARGKFCNWMLRVALPLYEREVAARANQGDPTAAPQQGRPATPGSRDVGIA
ncbi:MAG: hypothetical protein ACAI38_03890 [Myxococcota bacterium]|nr:hypothetical protein [Myxococcota bacterium]